MRFADRILTVDFIEASHPLLWLNHIFTLYLAQRSILKSIKNVTFEETAMAQLTGNLRGTDRADIFLGAETVVGTEGNLFAAGIRNAAIEAFSGNDSIEGIGAATLEDDANGSSGSIVEAYGILSSRILTGAGDDVVTAQGTAAAGSTASSATIRGYGLAGGLIDGEDGNDRIIVAGLANTEGSDFFDPVKSQNSASLGYGLYQATVAGGNGNDAIDITGTGGSSAGFARDQIGTGYGLLQSAVTGDGGNDVITIRGTGAEGGVPSLSTGYGVSDGSVDGNEGDDKITIIAQGLALGTSGSPDFGTAFSYGVFNGRVSGGVGIDTITVNATSVGSRTNAPSTSYGLFNATIDGGADADAITVTSESRAISLRFNNGDNASNGIFQSAVNGGSGDDRLIINSASFPGTFDTMSNGIFQSAVNGGSGNDTIRISANSDGSVVRSALFASTAIAASNSSVQGGTGNDAIDVTANAAAYIFLSRVTATADSLFAVTVEGGSGNDTIRISSTAEALSLLSFTTLLSTSYGVRSSSVLGNEGNDTIDITSRASSSPFSAETATERVAAYGASNSTIDGGSGNDTIRISAEASQVGFNIASSQTGYGVFNSNVNGGDGNDSITVTGTTLALQDALITGGSGDDLFDTGTGDGTIDGGTGIDRIRLDFFNAATMTLKLIGSGAIEITGSVDNLGNANAWTQRIFNVEQFAIGSQISSANQLKQLALA